MDVVILLLVSVQVGWSVLGFSVLALILRRPWRRRPRVDPKRVRAEAAELAAHAERLQIRAAAAVAEAVEAEQRFAAAEWEWRQARQTLEEADRAYAAARRSAFGSRRPGPGAPMRSARERAVERAALDAYRRGELDIEQLRRVWRRTAEPGTAQVRRERAVEPARMRQRWARRRHDAAFTVVRQAYDEVQIAEICARALVAEAVISVLEADLAGRAVSRLPRRRWVPAPLYRRAALRATVPVGASAAPGAQAG
ncbi:hypothetical protein [Melissospora conviva]|uniref:hypothetical protein n=1 Tax=Melissospora conviva TaxID=3388432 RepID=UPI003C1B39EA